VRRNVDHLGVREPTADLPAPFAGQRVRLGPDAADIQNTARGQGLWSYLPGGTDNESAAWHRDPATTYTPPVNQLTSRTAGARNNAARGSGRGLIVEWKIFSEVSFMALSE
jgi:hypothetical protein